MAFVPGVCPETTRAACPSTEIVAARLRADASDRYAANETVQPRDRADSAGAVSTGSRGGIGRGIGSRGARPVVESPGAGRSGDATAVVSALSGSMLVESESAIVTG